MNSNSVLKAYFKVNIVSNKTLIIYTANKDMKMLNTQALVDSIQSKDKVWH